MLIILIFRSFFQNVSLVIFIAFIPKQQNIGYCVDARTNITEGKICPASYYKVDGHCIVCQAGYIGINCSIQCPFPNFGLLCTAKCKCDELGCNPVFGCRNIENHAAISSKMSSVDTSVIAESTTVISSAFSSVDTSVIENTAAISTTVSSVDTSISEPIFLSRKPVTKANNNGKATQETNSDDNKFTVAFSVTVALTTLIVLVVLFTKMHSDPKRNMVYYIQRQARRTSLPPRNQFQVPFRNLETGIYTEIDELDNISNTRCGTIPEEKEESCENTIVHNN